MCCFAVDEEEEEEERAHDSHLRRETNTFLTTPAGVHLFCVTRH
jgi:hypothetical protein